jgi:hypothetical protein
MTMKKQRAYSRGLLSAQIELTICSRPDITLTDEQYSILQRRVTEFKNSNAAARSKIVKEAADHIERGWQEDMPPDREALETVSGLRSLQIGPFSWLLSWFADTY